MIPLIAYNLGYGLGGQTLERLSRPFSKLFRAHGLHRRHTWKEEMGSRSIVVGSAPPKEAQPAESIADKWDVHSNPDDPAVNQEWRHSVPKKMYPTFLHSRGGIEGVADSRNCVLPLRAQPQQAEVVRKRITENS